MATPHLPLADQNSARAPPLSHTTHKTVLRLALSALRFVFFFSLICRERMTRRLPLEPSGFCVAVEVQAAARESRAMRVQQVLGSRVMEGASVLAVGWNNPAISHTTHYLCMRWVGEATQTEVKTTIIINVVFSQVQTRVAVPLFCM